MASESNKCECLVPFEKFVVKMDNLAKSNIAFYREINLQENIQVKF